MANFRNFTLTFESDLKGFTTLETNKNRYTRALDLVNDDQKGNFQKTLNTKNLPRDLLFVVTKKRQKLTRRRK